MRTHTPPQAGEGARLRAWSIQTGRGCAPSLALKRSRRGGRVRCCSSVAAVDVWTVARWSAVVVLLLVGVPLLGGVWWWCVVCRKKYKYTTKKLYKNLVV